MKQYTLLDKTTHAGDRLGRREGIEGERGERRRGGGEEEGERGSRRGGGGRGEGSQVAVQHDARGDVCCDDRVGQDAAELLGDGERVYDDALAPCAVGHLPQLQRAAVRPLDGHQGHRHTEGETRDTNMVAWTARTRRMLGQQEHATCLDSYT